MVRVTVVECVVPPPVATTLMVDVDAGMSKPVPAPQPVIVKLSPASPASSSIESSRGIRLLARPPTNSPSATIASVMPSGTPRRPGTALPTSAEPAPVIVAVGGAVPGVTVAGENVAVAPAGNPLAASVTALLKGLPATSDAN